MAPVRVALLGAAGISWQTWEAIHLSGNKVTFVGCRERERGEAFVKGVMQALGLPADAAPALGSYDDAVSSDDVDVVYVPIPVTARDYWVKQCVAHKKHVVGEKPAAVDADELRGWIEALDAASLFYMDGCMFSHNKRIREIGEHARTKLGAPLKYIATSFSFVGGADFMASDIRLNPSLEPHGALGDLGWYNIRMILHLMDFAMPTEVSGRIIRQSDKGAVIAFSGQLTFEEKGNTTLATIYCAFDTAVHCNVRAIAADGKGSLEMHDFTQPINGRPTAFDHVVTSIDRADCRFDVTSQATTHTQEGESTQSQKVDMWKHVAGLLVEGEGGRLTAKSEEARYWATVAWKTQAVMDKLLQSARQSQA